MLVYMLTTIKYNIYGVSSFAEGTNAYKYKNSEITKNFQNIFSSDMGLQLATSVTIYRPTRQLRSHDWRPLLKTQTATRGIQTTVNTCFIKLLTHNRRAVWR